MPKAYAVVTYRSVSDPEKLAAYAKLAGPAVASFGARFLARGNAAVAREQGVKERTVVVEYPSLKKATAAYDSPAYAEALKALGDGDAQNGAASPGDTDSKLSSHPLGHSASILERSASDKNVSTAEANSCAFFR
jgi:uncharacterized protein (DUF1330 family)